MIRTSPLLAAALLLACEGPSYTALDDAAPSTEGADDAGASAEAVSDTTPGSVETPRGDTSPQAGDLDANDPDANDPDTNDQGVEDTSEASSDVTETPSDDESNSSSPDAQASEMSTSDGPAPQPGPSEGCASSDGLPASFARNCAGCHSNVDALTGSAPSLFAFEGGLEQFKDRVRSGGKAMPTFDEDAIAANDLETIFSYFDTGEPPANNASAPAGESCNGEALIGDACSGVNEAIVPLYSGTDTSAAAPLLTHNDDGSLTLRAGGRVRGRHEHEGDFSPFHTQYFENRSYTFIVEDTIPAGGNTLKVTWLPIADAAADQVINLRYWYTGDGNVFHTNVGMTRVEPMHWEWTADHNARDDRDIQLGDRFDFEFGVFYDAELVPGRTSYYSDTFRYVVGSGKLTAFDEPNSGAASGGDTTIPYIFAEPELYFEQMALNIEGDDAQQFLEGRRLFHTNFVTGEHTDAGNPALETQSGKAGPLANQATCADCHTHNGRGKRPADGGVAESLVFKTFDLESPNDAQRAHPLYGRQLQTLDADGFDAEGQVTVDSVEQVFAFTDGQEVSLRAPSYSFDGADALLSPRLPRPVIGLGLLEAIPEETLLAFADAEDCNGDGISGRANLVPDPSNGVLRIGRFGWKAGKVNVRHQVADALQLDMGVTTTLFPNLDCGDGGCDSASDPELADEDLERLETYMRLIGVPPQRDTADESVQRGQDAFLHVGCARCHVPTLATGSSHPLLELRDQVIHPYTDLLLHDMGAGLADPGAGESLATAGEWRTPPLWGLGLAASVNGEAQLLHDGRAASPLEAILWHGGEAESARNAFAALSSSERADLLAFLDSL